jgi:hypothetical protein
MSATKPNYAALKSLETAFLTRREVTTAKALRALCGVGDSTPTRAVRVALCFSGGGHRALIGTVGFLDACKRVGLLDGTLHIAGLSGSAWAVATWAAAEKDKNPFVRLATTAGDPWSSTASVATGTGTELDSAALEPLTKKVRGGLLHSGDASKLEVAKILQVSERSDV